MNANHWRIEMFGGCSASLTGQRAVRFRTRKAASLLALLACNPGSIYSREELLDVFWPDMDIEAARNNLRQTLCWLRGFLGESVNSADQILCSDKSSVWLTRGSVSTDVEEFQSLLESAAKAEGSDRRDALIGAVGLYRRELLAGYYEEWIFPERRRLESLFLTALDDLQAEHLLAGEPAKALPLALRAVELDPVNEAAHVAVMRIHAAMGNEAPIRRQLCELANVLTAELGEQPTSDTRMAANRLADEAAVNSRNAAAVPAAVAPARMAPQEFGRRPSWTRALAGAVGVSIVALGLISVWSNGRRSFASNLVGGGVLAVRELPADRMLADLRAIRVSGFAAGSPSEPQAVRRSHAEMCVALGEQAWGAWYGRDEERWLERFTQANDDLRAALRWLLEHDPEKAVQLSGALTRFWYVRGFPREGYRWLGESLAAAGAGHRTTARARALAGCAWLSEKYDANSEAQCREALSIFEEHGDRWGAAHALRLLGHVANGRLNGGMAVAEYRRALAIFNDLHDERGQAVTLLSLSFAAGDHNDEAGSLRRKEQSAEQSLTLFRKMGNRWGVSMALRSLAEAAALNHQPDKEEMLTREALAANPEEEGLTVRENEERATLALRKGDCRAARSHIVSALRIARDQGDRLTASCLLGGHIHELGFSDEKLARIVGGETSLCKLLRIDTPGPVIATARTLRSKMGSRPYEAAYQEGLRLGWEQTVEEATTN